MTTKKDILCRRAFGQIETRETTKLLTDLINIYSTTGEELEAAQYMKKYMTSRGLDTELQLIDNSRANAIGILRGHGGGESLMIFGHLDTSYTGVEEEDYPATGPLVPAAKPHAYIKGDWIFGLGAQNMKGGVTAMTIAAAALAQAGVELEGDLLIAAVSGETEKAPVKSLYRNYQGSKYMGTGIGINHLLTHGYKPNYAITSEPTGTTVERARCGFLGVRLTTRGKLTYSPYREFSEGQHAILRMMQVIDAFEGEFRPKFKAKYTYYLGEGEGKLVPEVNVGSIESGLPWKAGTVPAICCAYVDLRVVPHVSSKEVLKEFEEFLSSFQLKQGFQVEMELYFTSVDPTETPNVSKIVKVSKNAYEYVTGEKHQPRSQILRSASNDTNYTRLAGIPSVVWGPGGDIRQPQYKDALAEAGGSGEFVNIHEVLNSAKMYIVATLDICGIR